MGHSLRVKRDSSRKLSMTVHQTIQRLRADPFMEVRLAPAEPAAPPAVDDFAQSLLERSQERAEGSALQVLLR